MISWIHFGDLPISESNDSDPQPDTSSRAHLGEAIEEVTMAIEYRNAESMAKLKDCGCAGEWASAESPAVSPAWPEKHLLGTGFGPNENGRDWPSRRQRERVAR